MTVLILGCGGFIGRATAARAAARGLEVVGVARRPVESFDGRFRAGDREAPDTILDIVRAERVETVIDMAAMIESATRPLLDALDGAVERYVLISSCDVYGRHGALHRLEPDAPGGGPLDENAPLRTHLHPYRGEAPRRLNAPDRWLDDYDKIPIETAARGLARTAWTVLRLPMVYGPGDKQRRFRWAVEPMAAGAPRLAAPGAWLDWTATYGFVDNVGEAILAAAVAPETAGETYNIGEAAPQPHIAWVRRFADALGWRGEVDRTPPPDAPLARAAERLDLDHDLIVSSRKIRALTGFTEPASLDAAVALTLADELARSGLARR